MRNLMRFRRKIDSALQDHKRASQDTKREFKEYVQAENEVTHLEQAQKTIVEISQRIQEKVHFRISSLVSQCLYAVFQEEAYEFRIVLEKKRGQTEARLAFFREGHEHDPKSGVGIGVMDVASFGLRVAYLLLHPGARRLLIIDEPFKNLNGAQYQERMEGLLKMIAKDFEVQIIIVTDDEWLHIGKVINMEDER